MVAVDYYAVISQISIFGHGQISLIEMAIRENNMR